VKYSDQKYNNYFKMKIISINYTIFLLIVALSIHQI